ncbi:MULTISPECIES: hypothetical protein [unclassified Paenibacillus]|jgi:hypothetical protein|uniref:hypothetical protein n=1 Tax=unclassified Paenibacillus TaxID=185978 RepID=UPI00070C8A04|nr:MULTISPECIES: hypothetical protein [unclassified Paenibacillus]KQX67094.1 hypothetical protein ASD40_26960 [Paenibacillus sp. Root444D2]KRE49139.1 hypothetical protein ASG85_24740 [Paenibacillus sp. Soil724D2]
MVSRFMKLGLISFLSISALLGAHHYRMHSPNQQMISQVDSWEAAKQGSPTFFDTNPFGMPGADANLRKTGSMNSHAAGYGLTPPTSMKALKVHTQAANGAHDKASPWWNYLGLLGLIGLLGLGKRSRTS